MKLGSTACRMGLSAGEFACRVHETLRVLLGSNQELPATRASGADARFRWRDPDSNRGHHDFQARVRIPLIAPNALQTTGCHRRGGVELEPAICDFTTRVKALVKRRVPK